MSLVLDHQASMIHIGVKDVPVYMSILWVVHDKDLLQLQGQDIFLPLSSRYLELPSIHAQSSHFHQATGHSQVEESTSYEEDVQAASGLMQVSGKRSYILSDNSILRMQ